MADPASLTIALIAQDQRFNVRCLQIALQFAVNFVLTEDAATPLHNERAAFAAHILQRRVQPETLALVVLGDQNIAAAAIADVANNARTVADVNIDGRLQATWNVLALAGV